MLLAGALLTVWMMPRKSGDLTYELGRPWKYPLLTAPFDIPVYPDAEKVEHAKDSIRQAFVPTYKYDPKVRDAVIKSVNAALSEKHPATQTLSVQNRVKSLLNSGIVDSRTYNRIQTGALPYVIIDTGSGPEKRSTVNMRSAIVAYQDLKDGLQNPLLVTAVEEAGIGSFFEPNLLEDEGANTRRLEELYIKASAPTRQLLRGEIIIEQGQLITPQLYTILQTYEEMKQQSEEGSSLLGWVGKILYAFTLYTLLGFYLYFFRRKLFEQKKVLLFITSAVTIFAIMAFMLSELFSLGLYLVPVAMIAIVLTVFFDAGVAMFVSVLTTLLCAVIAGSPFEFIFMQFAGCIVGVLSLKELSRRSQLVVTVGYIYLSYCCSYLAINFILTASFTALNPWVFGVLALNIVCLSFAYVLIFLLERWLGFASLVGLVELSDINHPLLRELSRECPGTFQHSIAVSNLAGEAAAKLGANVQLIRAGALYHDIGKIDNPAFFTENQHGVNPHDALDAMQSARIITGHVTAGLRRAEKARLPRLIRDFIAQHHGRGVARYFYITYCNQHPDEEVDRAPFTYVGPNPQTLESSILMMADAVEAASRSLRSYDHDSISALVNKIIDSQIADGLHAESPLAFRDVLTIKECFIGRLLTIYHSRVAYPTANKPDK